MKIVFILREKKEKDFIEMKKANYTQNCTRFTKPTDIARAKMNSAITINPGCIDRVFVHSRSHVTHLEDPVFTFSESGLINYLQHEVHKTQ